MEQYQNVSDRLPSLEKVEDVVGNPLTQIYGYIKYNNINVYMADKPLVIYDHKEYQVITRRLNPTGIKESVDYIIDYASKTQYNTILLYDFITVLTENFDFLIMLRYAIPE